MDITGSANSKSSKNATTAFKGKANSLAFSLNGVGAHTLNSQRVFTNEIQSALSDFLGRCGIPLDLNQPWVQQLTPENTKAIIQLGEQARRNAKFLPEVVAAIRKLATAEVAEAKAKKSIVKIAAECGYAIDQQQAEAFLILTNYQQKQKRLEKRIQTLAQLKQKRTQAYEGYYENSVAGTQARIIDAEFEVMGESQKILEGSRMKKLEFKKQQKQSAADYYDQAFQ